MDRREEIIAAILSHASVHFKRDKQGGDWVVAEIRRDLTDELLYETKLIPGAETVVLGIDLYTDIIALRLFDELTEAQSVKKERQKGASIRERVTR